MGAVVVEREGLGNTVGETVDDIEGLDEGTLLDGDSVGSTVVEREGLRAGDAEGSDVDFAVGFIVVGGTVEGIDFNRVGLAVGPGLGATDGRNVGFDTGVPVGV